MVDTQRNTWDKVASEISFSLEPDLKKLATLINKDAKILDYGCGYGRVTANLHEDGYKNTTGVDTSIGMIRRGLKQYPMLDLQYIESYRIPDGLGKFDVILLCAVLTCVPNRECRLKITEAVNEALNEDGIFYCVEFHKSDAINYSPFGTFSSSFNVEMKHFLPNEISEELAIFDEIICSVSEATTMTGTKINAIHYLGKKF
ncbi:MAG TPA: methyltransferase domain-containing protein [Methylophilaceae bacterium]|nr:methyltransferase domain-containing protein [Methylophilaceae bacterium]